MKRYETVLNSEGDGVMFRLFTACLVMTMVLLSACQPTDPPEGEVLALSKQVKTKMFQSYEPVTMEWRSLIPEDYTFEYQYQNLYAWMSEEERAEATSGFLESTPIVEELDQQDIRLTGYVVPLASDADSISEFLLVPIEGACLHVPAPPANQIVHVKPYYPLPHEDSYSLINIVGTLTSEGSTSTLAAASYTMDKAVLEPYVEKDEEVVMTANGRHVELGR